MVFSCSKFGVDAGFEGFYFFWIERSLKFWDLYVRKETNLGRINDSISFHLKWNREFLDLFENEFMGIIFMENRK
jgi:hypothetical protein